HEMIISYLKANCLTRDILGSTLCSSTINEPHAVTLHINIYSMHAANFILMLKYWILECDHKCCNEGAIQLKFRLFRRRIIVPMVDISRNNSPYHFFHLFFSLIFDLE